MLTFFIKKKKNLDCQILKGCFFSNLTMDRFNYLPFLLHNFSGFLTLDAIIKHVHKGLIARHKFFVFSGNVVKFEYRYKFDEINLRALKPKQNELFIYIDFGLKRILQFNSKQFYLYKESIVETSDRVNAFFYKLDTFFEDQFIWGYSFNKKNLNFLTKKFKKQSLISLPNIDLKNLKYFVDDFILKSYLFSYTALTQQFLLHASLVNFYNSNLFNFLFISNINFFSNCIKFSSNSSLLQDFFDRFNEYNFNFFSGFFWYQRRVKGKYPHRHSYHLKTAPYFLRRRLYKFYHAQNFKTKRRLFRKKIKIDKKSLFFKQVLNKPKIYLKKQKKIGLILKFIFNLLTQKRKFKNYNKSYFTKFKILVLRAFVLKSNLAYFLKLKLKRQFNQRLIDSIAQYAKKHREHQFDLNISYLMNKNNKNQIGFFINNSTYLDQGFILKRKNLLEVSKKIWTRGRYVFFRKKIYVIKRNLRKLKIRKFFFNNIGGSCIQIQINSKIRWKSKKMKKTLSKKNFLKLINIFISTNKHFQLKNWIQNRFSASLFNFFGLLPAGFSYSGLVKEEMYLYYKKFFAIICNQLEFLTWIMRYFWLTNYLKILMTTNINKTQLFKHGSFVCLNKFTFKMAFNDYLIDLIKAFGYSTIIRMQNFEFMTSQLPKIIAPADQKNMKFFWRTLKTDFAPAIVDNIKFLEKSNFSFVKFSLLFLMFYNFFLYHKRFDFKIGVSFWSSFMKLKDSFNVLFIKETTFNFVFYKDYSSQIIKLIKKNNKLFIRLLYFFTKILAKKYNNLFVVKSGVVAQDFFFLNTMLFFRNNIFKFFFPVFFISYYKISRLYNITFTTSHSYLNYKKIYNKLFPHIDLSLTIGVTKKKIVKFSGLQSFIFNIRNVRNLFNYKQLLAVWDWNTLQLHSNNNIKENSKFNINLNTSCFFLFIEKSFLLFNLKLKQQKIINVNSKKNYQMPHNLNYQPNYFYFYKNRTMNNVILIKKRLFSIALTTSNRKNSFLSSSKILRKFIIKNRTKNLLYNKRFHRLTRYYKIFKFYNKHKKYKILYLYLFLKQNVIYTKKNLNKKRLNFLLSYNNLFKNKGTISLALVISILQKLIFKFKFAHLYKIFLLNYISKFIVKSFNLNLFFNMRVLRLFFFSIFYSLTFMFNKRILNKPLFLLFKFKNILNYFFKTTNIFNQVDVIRRLRYLEFFTNNVNFMFYKNVKSLHKIFNKQCFNLHITFKNKTNCRTALSILKNRTNKRITESTNFFAELYSFKLDLISNGNNDFSLFKNLGFFYFAKLSFFTLFFFNILKFKNIKNDLKILFLKSKHFFLNISSFKLNFEFKRLRFFIFVLNTFLKKLSSNSNSNFKINKHFWIANLLKFTMFFKMKNYKKALLYKYNYHLFFKLKKNNNTSCFVRNYFLKKSYKLIKFLYNYGGSRFCKFKNIKKTKKKYFKLLKKKYGKSFFYLKKRSKLKNNSFIVRNIEFEKHYKQYFLFKNSLLTSLKVRFFLKRLKKLGFNVSTFFSWLIPKRHVNWQFSKIKNSVKNILWQQGTSYEFNKLQFLKCIMHSCYNPLINKYIVHKKKLKVTKREILNQLVNPIKTMTYRNYNVNTILGNFFKKPYLFCLTRRKRKELLNKKKQLHFIFIKFIGLWKQRVLLFTVKNNIVRGDAVYFLKQYLRKLRSRKFYFIMNLLYMLKTKSNYKVFMDPFLKRVKYNKYFVNPKYLKKHKVILKNDPRFETRVNPYLYFLQKRHKKRKYRNKLKYNTFLTKIKNKKLYSSMTKFAIHKKKQVKYPFHLYYNLLPWQDNKNYGDKFSFHNDLFTKYRKALEKFRKENHMVIKRKLRDKKIEKKRSKETEIKNTSDNVLK